MARCSRPNENAAPRNHRLYVKTAQEIGRSLVFVAGYSVNGRQLIDDRTLTRVGLEHDRKWRPDIAIAKIESIGEGGVVVNIWRPSAFKSIFCNNASVDPGISAQV